MTSLHTARLKGGVQFNIMKVKIEEHDKNSIYTNLNIILWNIFTMQTYKELI